MISTILCNNYNQNIYENTKYGKRPCLVENVVNLLYYSPVL